MKASPCHLFFTTVISKLVNGGGGRNGSPVRRRFGRQRHSLFTANFQRGRTRVKLDIQLYIYIYILQIIMKVFGIICHWLGRMEGCDWPLGAAD